MAMEANVLKAGVQSITFDGIQLTLDLDDGGKFTAKTKDGLIRRFPKLADLADREWNEFFFNHGKDWTTEDLEYLEQFYESDDILNLSYALGRTPTTLISTMAKLRAQKSQQRGPVIEQPIVSDLKDQEKLVQQLIENFKGDKVRTATSAKPSYALC